MDQNGGRRSDMYYSDDMIEEVRTRNDIVDVISGYVKLQRKGSSYFGLCPFHNEKSPSFSVSPSKQMYYCFGCGAGGNVFTFLMEYENFTFPEAVKALADRAGDGASGNGVFRGGKAAAGFKDGGCWRSIKWRQSITTACCVHRRAQRRWSI